MLRIKNQEKLSMVIAHVDDDVLLRELAVECKLDLSI